MTIAGRIVFLRGRLGLSQKAFAGLIGKSPGYMNRIENGKSAPTEALIREISETFGVPAEWLATGEGSVGIASVGDRIRQARRARGYTQEELATELGLSRNAVGMMERGAIRPSDESIHLLCHKLWIQKHWLMTGQGSMERMELTPFYELLQKEPEVREHIRSYIDHLERGSQREEKDPDEDGKAVMVPARINDVDAAREFFTAYHIPYEEGVGENAGMLLVKKTRDIDWERSREVEDRCRRARIPEITDHPAEFRDEEDNTIVTFSPYDSMEGMNLPWIERLERSIYGYGTTTFVVKC